MRIQYRLTWVIVGLCCWANHAAFAGVDAAELDRLRARFADGVLRWGGDAEGGAPYQLRDPQDPSRVIGFEVELADALAEELGRRLDIPLAAEFAQYDWVSLPLGLEKRDFDLVLSGYEITPQNQENLRFSRPYYIFSQQLVVRHDETRIQTLDDVLDRPVGTLTGSAADHLLQMAGAMHIVRYDGQTEPYLDLALGRVDAVLLDMPIAVYYASFDPRLKFVGEPFAPGEYGVGMRHDDEALAGLVDECLGELMCNGKLREIYQRWRLYDANQVELALAPNRDAELAGLGFLPDGTLSDEPQLPEAERVDVEVISASSTRWTFSRYAPLLFRAALTTVDLTVRSMALAIVLGLVIAVARLYGPWPVRALALAYIEFFRGIPLLLLLFFLYFGLPHISWGLDDWRIQLSAYQTAILGFGLNYAAYEAEIYRSAILSVPIGQWEAARALGMSEPLTFRRIILPQALRTALGPMTNDFVAMFKDTSLVSVIAVHELTKEYLILSRSSFMFVEMGLLTAFLYLAMSVPLGYLSRWLETQWGGERRIHG